MTKSSRNYCVARKPSVEQKLQSEQIKARKKEILEVQHPRMTNVFDQRNTNQSQEMMDLSSRDLEFRLVRVALLCGHCGHPSWKTTDSD